MKEQTRYTSKKRGYRGNLRSTMNQETNFKKLENPGRQQLISMGERAKYWIHV
jgi:hypothetical protein